MHQKAHFLHHTVQPSLELLCVDKRWGESGRWWKPLQAASHLTEPDSWRNGSLRHLKTSLTFPLSDCCLSGKTVCSGVTESSQSLPLQSTNQPDTGPICRHVSEELDSTQKAILVLNSIKLGNWILKSSPFDRGLCSMLHHRKRHSLC